MNKDMSSQSIIEKFATWHCSICNLSESSVKRYRVVCTKWSEFLRKREVEHISRSSARDLQAYIEKRQHEDRVTTSTIKHDLTIIKTLEEYMVNFCGGATCPTKHIPKCISTPAKEKSCLSIKDVFAMLNTCDTTDPVDHRNYIIIALLWSTGLRSSELIALNWKDIDLKNATLLVRKGKGRKQRQLFLCDRFLDDLSRYRQSLVTSNEMPLFCQYTTSKRKDNNPLRISSNSLCTIVRDAAHSAGIKENVTPLTLRHTFATHMYDAGVDISDIKEMMGHSDRCETTVYIHVSLDAIKLLLNEQAQKIFIPREARR